MVTCFHINCCKYHNNIVWSPAVGSTVATFFSHNSCPSPTTFTTKSRGKYADCLVTHYSTLVLCCEDAFSLPFTDFLQLLFQLYAYTHTYICRCTYLWSRSHHKFFLYTWYTVSLNTAHFQFSFFPHTFRVQSLKYLVNNLLRFF